MINNFDKIEEFMQFQPGTFYKFECLVRNTDRENILFPNNYSNSNKNILIKSYYVDNLEYYNKIKQEMINLCNITGARLYITLDRKSILKLISELSIELTRMMTCILQGSQIGIKTLSKVFASKTSVKETSCKETKTLMWDVDTKNEEIKHLICWYIKRHGQTPIILESKKGYHIVCYKKFNNEKWYEHCTNEINKMQIEYTQKEMFIEQLQENVSVLDNQLGLVYIGENH